MTSFATTRLLDLGSGLGNSLIDAEGRFGMRGVGIELNPDRVERARERGLDVHQGDLLTLDPAAFPRVDYVYLDNVLEHLPTLDDIDAAIGIVTRIAHRLVLIRHPSFEDVEYLAGLGVKLHWTDWPTDHTAPARVHELVAMANRHGIYRIVVRPINRISGTSHTTVLPMSAPRNQHRPDRNVPLVYDEAKHGPKPDVEFDRPVYDAFEILLMTGDGTAELGADPTGRDLPEIAWRSVPGEAPVGWSDDLAKAIGTEAKVVELPDGRVKVIEAGTSRVIATPLLARALVHMFGAEPMSVQEHDLLPDGPPVTALKVTGTPAFVVVGGVRHDLPRIPATVMVDASLADRFDKGDPLDLLRAAESLLAERRAGRS